MEGPVSSCELVLASCGTCTTSEFRKMLSRTRLRRDNHPSNPSVVTTVPTGIFSHSVWVLTFGSGIMRGPLCLLGRSGRRWRAEGWRARARSLAFPGVRCPVVTHVPVVHEDTIHGALCCHLLQSGRVGSARRSLWGGRLHRCGWGGWAGCSATSLSAAKPPACDLGSFPAWRWLPGAGGGGTGPGGSCSSEQQDTVRRRRRSLSWLLAQTSQNPGDALSDRVTGASRPHPRR